MQSFIHYFSSTTSKEYPKTFCLSRASCQSPFPSYQSHGDRSFITLPYSSQYPPHFSSLHPPLSLLPNSLTQEYSFSTALIWFLLSFPKLWNTLTFLQFYLDRLRQIVKWDLRYLRESLQLTAVKQKWGNQLVAIY